MYISAMLVGDFDLPEFRSAAEYMRRRSRIAEVVEIHAAIERLASGEPAELLLVALSHRSQFTREQIEELRAVAPLSRLCALVGSWCEGETRSGHAWPGVERLYVNQLIPRAGSEGWLENRRSPSPPATASNEERWLHRATVSLPVTGKPVVVCSQISETRHALSDVCRSGGFRPLGIAPLSSSHGDPYAIVYDGHRNRGRRIQEIDHLVRAFPSAGLVALIEYPRFDEIQQIMEAGGHCVLGKPFDLVDLIGCLHAAGRSAASQDSAA